jgi:8-oxo-dGTP pyrophosphatase MutT (NUDIX family)
MIRLIDNIAEHLNAGLPGQEAQFQMASLNRYTKVTPPDNAVDASVLLLLYPGISNELKMVFIERMSENLNDHHRGQISFPGGRFEKTDADFAETALREAEEEIGVAASSVEIIGALTELFVPVSGYLIHPYVGFTNKTPSFIPQQSEVQSIIESDLETIMDRKARKYKDVRTPSNMLLKNVPYFDIEGRTVWGATAMILNEFLHLKPLQNGL